MIKKQNVNYYVFFSRRSPNLDPGPVFSALDLFFFVHLIRIKVIIQNKNNCLIPVKPNSVFS